MARRLFINQINIRSLNRGAIRILDHSSHERTTQSTNGINFPTTNSLVRQRRERLTGFDYKKRNFISSEHLKCLHGRQAEGCGLENVKTC